MSKMVLYLDLYLLSETLVDVTLREGVNVVASCRVPIGRLPDAMLLLGHTLVDKVRTEILGYVEVPR